jgi:hypothetical protein
MNVKEEMLATKQGGLLKKIRNNQRRRVHGCGGSIASLLKNKTKIFLPIIDLEKIFHTSKY